MLLYRTQRFKKDFRLLEREVQERTSKTLQTFVRNPRHPALVAKKMEGAGDIWEMRTSDNYRITFQFVEGGILLRRIGTHNVLQHP